jgi:hypothetical protein
MGTYTSLGQVGQIPVTATSSIRVSFVESGGARKVDVRLWIDSDRYSGPTRKGIRIGRNELVELLPLLQKAAQDSRK